MAGKIKGSVTSEKLPANFFSVFKKEAKMRANQRTRKFAKQIAAEAKDIIKKQKFDWAPLSESYAEHKWREGLDDRIMIATAEYVNKGIGYWEKAGQIFVGPKPGKHSKSGIPYQLLGRWLEFGTWKMPARQLWRPLLSTMIQKSKGFKREYRAAVARVAREAARRKVKKRSKKV